MPVYQVDLQYRYETEYWSNKFFIIATDIADATEWVNGAATILAGNMPPSTEVQKARIIPQPFVKNVFRDVILDKVGLTPWAQPMPLFNVVRWDFSGDYGRAVHHYMRALCPPEAIGGDQKFTPTWQGFNTAVVGGLFDLPQPLCDKSGNAYTHAGANPLVGMRQLRRGSKRKVRPII